MQQILPNDSTHYDELVARQIDQYKETEIMHALPGIYDYVAKKYTSERAALVTGCMGLIEFYGEYFRKSLQESDSNFLISIGSGDCSLEIEIVKYILARKETNFFFVCLELSPILIGKARKKIDAEGLKDVITVVQTDINKWSPKYTFAGVMAHHSLHHFLNLEELFDLIKKNLAPNGRFLTCDIIGRNGHMRWPESLLLTREIWKRIPRKYKFHHLFQRYDDYFDNWDCSVEGFEGIRAQDILPLLLKMFSFEAFYCHGNLIDPFIDRAFGPNYDPASSLDTAFIDYVHELNDRLISGGILKPTSMTAVMVNEKVSNPIIFKHWSPAFAMRDPSLPPSVYDVEPLLKNIPFEATQENDPLIINQVDNYALNKKLLFGNNTMSPVGNESSGRKYLTYGWGNAESSFTWSTCEDAALVFPLETKVDSDLELMLEFILYHSALHTETIVDILINDTLMRNLYFKNTGRNNSVTVNITIPASLIKNQKIIELRFLLPGRRQPQFESGDDLRALGIGLISATIFKQGPHT